jgi:hypothetical protein
MAKIMKMMRMYIYSICTKTINNSFNKKKLKIILIKFVKMNLWILKIKNFQKFLQGLFIKHQIKRNLFLILKICNIL